MPDHRSAQSRRPARSSMSYAQRALSGLSSSWTDAHARCLLQSLGGLRQRWLASLLTTLVIGIALALPTGLYVLVKNLDTLAGSWHRSVQVSLYLKDSVDTGQGRQLATTLAEQDEVTKTRFISAAEGLAQFRKHSSFGDALAALSDNPLPGAIIATPRAGLSTAEVAALVKRLQNRPGVETAQLDQAWLQRLTAILSLLERAAWVIGGLLAAAVLFIIGNTIRLDIENRREEIEIMKLLGATDAFIRRPFLYSGFWYGLFGAILSLLLLGSCFWALAGPIAALTRSYNGAVNVQGLSVYGCLAVLGSGIFLGWSGCAITVTRRLLTIEPR